MSFPRYFSYKDCGVDWIGEIPDHWSVWKLSRSFQYIGSGTTPKSDETEYYEDGNVPWLNTGDLNDGELFDCPKRVTDVALAKHSSLKLYPSGSVVIAMYGATIGKLALLRFSSTVNQACCVFAGTSRVSPEFLFYWLMGYRTQIVSMASGGGQPNINQEILRNLRIACPDLREQSIISTFLDRETAKIDSLISEQEKLISLLKEKRKAVISHAVTKGLNPRVSMKDSGVEWLGNVPDHWVVCKIGYRYSIELGKMLDEKRIVGQWLVPYLRNQDVQWGSINSVDLPEMDIMETERERYTVRKGDLLVCEGGNVGRAAIWRGPNNVIGFQKALHRVRPCNCDVDNVEFLFFALYAAKVLGVYERSELKSTISHLPAEKFRRYHFAFPPLDEQKAITAYLNHENSNIGALIAEAQRAIDILKERRTALISAAVTGKIDVRQLVQEEVKA